MSVHYYFKAKKAELQVIIDAEAAEEVMKGGTTPEADEKPNPKAAAGKKLEEKCQLLQEMMDGEWGRFVDSCGPQKRYDSIKLRMARIKWGIENDFDFWEIQDLRIGP